MLPTICDNLCEMVPGGVPCRGKCNKWLSDPNSGLFTRAQVNKIIREKFAESQNSCKNQFNTLAEKLVSNGCIDSTGLQSVLEKINK